MKRFGFPKVIFFLLLIFLPQQFGPHFWPPFSYVNGIRLDYLSPSVYVSDILIILLFVSSCRTVFKNKRVLSFLGNKLFLLFALILCIPFLYAAQPLAILFGIIKIIEFLYVGLYIVSCLTKKDLVTIVQIFAVMGVFEAFLGIVQFIKQGSIHGVLYFVGERMYSLSTPGIAAMNTPQGLMVRPYGTFSHPNVLSFFLFVCVVFSTYGMHHAKNIKRYVFLAAILLIEAGILVTFSRTVLVLNIVFLLYAFGYVPLYETRQKVKGILFAAFLFLFSLLYVFINPIRFFELSGIMHDYIPRLDLFKIGLSALFSSPLFGLGLNNFYYYEASIQTNFSSTYLQPVHNIFLLIASQTGTLGLLLFGYFLTVGLLTSLRLVKSEKTIFSFSEIPLVLLLSLLFVGLLDHYAITVQQGQLLFAIIMGLVFSSLWVRSR